MCYIQWCGAMTIHQGISRGEGSNNDQKLQIFFGVLLVNRYFPWNKHEPVSRLYDIVAKVELAKGLYNTSDIFCHIE